MHENENTHFDETEDAIKQVFVNLVAETEESVPAEELTQTEPAQPVQEPQEIISNTEMFDEASAPVETLLSSAEPQEPEGAFSEEAPAPEGPKNWYVIHTYSGYENKVRDNLLRRIDTMNMRDKIFKVLVPTEEEVEYRDGKKRTVQKKIYPGYVLIEMVMSDDSWYVVRNTQGVTGFVGPSVKPTPVSDSEIKQILRIMGMETGVKVKISFEKGQGVKIKSGPFKDFTGLVDEIYHDREKVKVLVFIFGRETPVELDFRQVEKL